MAHGTNADHQDEASQSSTPVRHINQNQASSRNVDQIDPTASTLDPDDQFQGKLFKFGARAAVALRSLFSAELEVDIENRKDRFTVLLDAIEDDEQLIASYQPHLAKLADLEPKDGLSLLDALLPPKGAKLLRFGVAPRFWRQGEQYFVSEMLDLPNDTLIWTQEVETSDPVAGILVDLETLFKRCKQLSTPCTIPGFFTNQNPVQGTLPLE